jgi:hypothetical protein
MKNPDEPPTLSEARIAANRENAKKSTGPTSAAGKATSSRNRLTHGMRANKHVLLYGDNPEDFLLLLKSLDDTFRPVGEAEEMLVTRIAADQWRLDRNLAMEEGVYRERIDDVAARDYSRKKQLINHKKNHEREPDRFSPPPAPPDPADLLARAFMLDSEERNSIANANRYKAAAQLSIDRNLRQLKIYQAARLANTPPDQPANPETAAPSPVTPPESVNYHSNPTCGADPLDPLFALRYLAPATKPTTASAADQGVRPTRVLVPRRLGQCEKPRLPRPLSANRG